MMMENDDDYVWKKRKVGGSLVLEIFLCCFQRYFVLYYFFGDFYVVLYVFLIFVYLFIVDIFYIYIYDCWNLFGEWGEYMDIGVLDG